MASALWVTEPVGKRYGFEIEEQAARFAPVCFFIKAIILD